VRLLRAWRAWFVRMKGLAGGRCARELEIADEIESHLQMHVEDNLRLGMTPAEARRAAKLRLGGVERTMQAYRERGTVPVFESFVQDLRFALRQLRKNPGFTATAILMVALGMGASVAIFAFVDAALIQPMPYRDPARLVSVFETVDSCPLCNVSYQNWRDWRKMATAFSSLEAWGYTRYMTRGAEGAEPATGTRVSDGFFRTLGVAPMLGRDFYAGEDAPGAPRTVLMSYGAWQKRFGGRPDVVGQVITLSDIPYTIIGVLPREFHFAPRGESEFWAALNEPNGCDQRRGCHGLFGLGRLKDGVTVASAAANMEALAAQFGRQYPDSNHGYGATAIPLSEAVVGEIRPVLLVLLCGAGMLLLIACVNVASLLLVRAESRRQEIALRGALGATARRLVRQFATESVVLVTVGTGLGIAGAAGTMRLLLKLIPENRLAGMPFLLELGFSGRVLGFAALVALGAALTFALAPALRLVFSRTDLRGELAAGGRGSAGVSWRRLGARLVMVELAAAAVLLVGAGLLGKSLFHLLHVDVGFETDHLATVVVSVPKSIKTDAQLMALERAVEERVGGLPGVQSVSIASQTPVMSWDGGVSIVLPGQKATEERNDLPERDVSAGYLKTIGARLVAGRYYSEAEDDGTKPRVVVVNESLARHFFPGEDAVGKRLAYDRSTETMRIIGVVEDVKEGPLDTPNRGVLYVPFNQDSSETFVLVARTGPTPETMLGPMATAVHAVDPLIAVSEEESMDGIMQDSQAAYLHRSSAWLVGGFAGIALVLAVVGLYGVIAYSVAQRRREIGVRMALGAQRGSVYRLILREAGWLAGGGIAAGLVGAVGLGILMRSLLFGVSAWDAPTLVAVAGVLGSAAMVASYLPARRAAAVNPVEALRAE
jgi:macrolide transport system ATP-binding/permease protein